MDNPKPLVRLIGACAASLALAAPSTIATGEGGPALAAAGRRPSAAVLQPPTTPPPSSTAPVRELRGAWIDRSSLVSRDEIRRTMTTLGAGNFNVAFVLVWSRGYPLWRSPVFERETGLATDPEYGGRDVLAEAIEEARAAGIHVMPWVEYGFVGGYTAHHPGKNGCGPIFGRHPDWVARTRSGETRFAAPGGHYCWMVHTREDVQAFLLALMEELATRYRTAGIQFDRARYPNLECGYDEVTRELYGKASGKSLPDDPKDPHFQRWRADGLNAFVKTLYDRLKRADPRGLVSNAPIVFPYGYDNFAQDYPAWLKAGAADFMVPQIYRKDVVAYSRELDAQIAIVGSVAKLVAGVDVTNSNADVLVQMIEATRQRKLPGVVVWYYRGMERVGALDVLRAKVFQQKAALPF
jgi:uncharacterized lipoprotein YddW (UPF0748 family)